MPRQLTHDFGLDINEQHLNQMCVTNCGRRAYNLGTMCRECWDAKNLASYKQAINNAKANRERWCFTHYFNEPVWVSADTDVLELCLLHTVLNVRLNLNTASVIDQLKPAFFTAFPLEMFSFAQAKVP